VEPEPNGISRVFAVPDGRLVSGSIRVYLDNEDITPPEWDDTMDPVTGEYLLLDTGRLHIEAPDTGQILRVSYGFQWFTDAELMEFLTGGSQLIGYTEVEDPALTPQLRSPVLSYAAHYAYLKMAANAAQALQAGAAGYTADNTAEHPNWMAMADLAWKTAEREIMAIANNPLTIASPAMAFVRFHMARYVPRS